MISTTVDSCIKDYFVSLPCIFLRGVLCVVPQLSSLFTFRPLHRIKLEIITTRYASRLLYGLWLLDALSQVERIHIRTRGIGAWGLCPVLIQFLRLLYITVQQISSIATVYLLRSKAAFLALCTWSIASSAIGCGILENTGIVSGEQYSRSHGSLRIHFVERRDPSPHVHGVAKQTAVRGLYLNNNKTNGRHLPDNL